MLATTIDQLETDYKDYKTLVSEQEDRVRSELELADNDDFDDFEEYLAEERKRVEALSDEELDREMARDAYLSIWGPQWPLFAEDALLTDEERIWKQRMNQLEEEDASW